MIFKPNTAESYYEPNSTRVIDGIAPTTRGHEITLRFLQPRTVESNATLRLSGGVAAEVKADDILCLVFDGANWHETSRVVK